MLELGFFALSCQRLVDRDLKPQVRSTKERGRCTTEDDAYVLLFFFA